jgi:cation diffusion facilitator CzcD-associated flavoprotein CzcO
MAPDLNSLSLDEKIDYSQPGSSGYDVRQDATWMDPKNRKLRVLSIGAGVSGILMAYQIQKLCENVEHVIYEKNEDIAGTWLENRYPGCACDIPSHAYTYNFALNPDWPKFFSHAPDIFAYLEKVCKTFDLRKYMNFHTEVVGAYWQEEKGEWLVKLRENRPGQEPREFEDHCHMLLHGTGLLNNFKWPDIPGLKDKFKGKVVHTARWPKDYQEKEWANDRIAVIGSGASSIQTVPTMQKHAKHLDVFVRTGVWFVSLASNTGQNKEYSQEERDKFRHDPKALVIHAKYIEDQVNGLWGAFYEGSESQKMAKEMFQARMAEWIKDERLLKGFTPEFGVGCRRITPGDPYMLAIQEENVDVHFTPVVSCTEDGVVGEDGVERKVDTIVCATGFDVSYRPRFPIVGKDGVDLAEKWKVCPEAYLGVCIPDMPNLVTFIGPTWPVESELTPPVSRA